MTPFREFAACMNFPPPMYIPACEIFLLPFDPEKHIISPGCKLPLLTPTPFLA